jgi:hypothetical protein
MKDRDPAKARRLMPRRGGVEKLSLESLGWLLPVLSGDPNSAREVDAIRRHVNNRVTENSRRGALRRLLQRRRLHHPSLQPARRRGSPRSADW